MFRFFTSDFRRNVIKLLCLTVGLALGFVLVAKIYLETSFDAFYPHADRIYLVTENFTQNGEYSEYQRTPGAIAPGLKGYSPQVEAATRHTVMFGLTAVKLRDGRSFGTDGIYLADSCHFDVLERRIITGDPHRVLAVKHQCMIPQSLAEKIGGDPVGMEISVPSLSDSYWATIGGIYEDYPLNSSVGNAIMLSLPTIGTFMHDGTGNWLGNDCYYSYVKLVEGASVSDVTPNLPKMLADNIPADVLEMCHFNLGMLPLTEFHSLNAGVKTMTWILAVLAVIVLAGSALNYLLIVIGQMGRREKEMAIRKCYGTGNPRLFARIICESLFFLAVSMVLAILVVLCFSDECRRLLGYSAEELLSTGRVWGVELFVCLCLLVITGIIPAWMYCRTPVAHAFRQNANSRRRWKLGLLAIQFAASALLVCLLSLVIRQYRMITNGDMGYEYENLASVSLDGIQLQTRAAIYDELKRLGCVVSVSSAYHDFATRASGNNVWINEDSEDKTVNVADMYYADSEIIETMGFKLLQGETFRETADTCTRQVIVEERFIDVLNKLGVEGRDIVGKTFNITEHDGLDGTSEFTICGVIGNIRRGGYSGDTADSRAGVLFPSGGGHVDHLIYVRFRHLTPEALRSAQEVIDRFAPDREVYIVPFKNNVDALNAPVERFGTSVMVAGVAILLITVIGLVGYMTDEVQRRSKEIAIRKVNGTSVSGILGLLCLDMLKVAVPSLLLGGAAAVIIGRGWLAQFTDQVSLSPLAMALCLTMLLLLILAVVITDSLKVARSTPVSYLRNE